MKVRTKLTSSFAAVAIFSAVALALPTLIQTISGIKYNINAIAELHMDDIYKEIDDYVLSPIESIESVMNYLNNVDSFSREKIENFFIADEKIGTEQGDDDNYAMFYYATETPLTEGGFLYSDVHWNPPEGWDYSTRSWYISARNNNGKATFTDPYLDDRTKMPVVTISESYINDKNEYKGVIGLDLEMGILNELMNTAKFSSDGTTFIFDRDGKYITNSNVDKIGKDTYSSDFDVAEIKNQIEKQDKFFTENYNGNYYFSRKMPDLTGWTVLTTGSTKSLYAAVKASIINICSITAGILAVAILFSLWLSSIIIKPVKVIGSNLDEIASGNADLTKRIKKQHKDEIGDVAEGFNRFTEKLHEIISRISGSKNTLKSAGELLVSSTEETASSITQIISNIDSVHEQINNQGNSVSGTAGAVNQISSNIQTLENLIESQSSGVIEASAAVEEMIGNISSVSNSVEKMAASFDSLQSDAQTGAAKQMDVNEKIIQIDNESKMLQEANAAISAIAEQTNLLAMNAAIEAAHAGEAGKGFSVVADEIRKLSETSAVQSKTIGDQLTLIQNSIEDVVQSSNDSNQAFTNVSQKIKDTDQVVRQIKSAMEEQMEGSRQITDALKLMNDSTSEVKSAYKEMSDGNKQILKEMNDLQDSTNVITQSVEEMFSGANRIKETSNALTDISEKMQNVIKDIGSQIDLFTI